MSADLEPLLKRLHPPPTHVASGATSVSVPRRRSGRNEALLLTLFAEEVAHRRGTRLARAVRTASFPFLRTVDEFDFTYQSTLRLTTIGSLLTPDFVTEGRAVILEGKPGRGKTHLAIAIAYRAMQNGFDALFTTAAQLIEELSSASREGRLREALSRYMKPHVLVVDEVGYLAYGDDAANVLYHVVNDRHIRGRSMIFTTNKHPKRWGDVLHDDDLADAIVDRILERGRLLRLDGPSVRTKHLPDDELRIDVQDNVGGGRVSGIEAAEFPERTRIAAAFELGRRATRDGIAPTSVASSADVAAWAATRLAELSITKSSGCSPSTDAVGCAQRDALREEAYTAWACARRTHSASRCEPPRVASSSSTTIRAETHPQREDVDVHAPVAAAAVVVGLRCSITSSSRARASRRVPFDSSVQCSAASGGVDA